MNLRIASDWICVLERKHGPYALPLRAMGLNHKAIALRSQGHAGYQPASRMGEPPFPLCTFLCTPLMCNGTLPQSNRFEASGESCLLSQRLAWGNPFPTMYVHMYIHEHWQE